MKGILKRTIALVMVFVLMSADICAIAEAVATLTLPKAMKVVEDEAFCGNTSIEKVIVPDGATEIGNRAFANSSLLEINLPDSLEFIADDAFEGVSEVTVSAEEGSYAYDWATAMGLLPNTLGIESVLSDKTKAEVGDQITWAVRTVRVDGKAFYRYTLSVDGEVVENGNYVANNFFTYQADREGTYVLSVNCFDNGGVPAKGFAEPVIVDKAVCRISGVIHDGNAIAEGDTINWVFETTEEKENCEFAISLLKDGREIIAQNGLAEAVYSYTAADAGSYVLKVTCIDGTETSSLLSKAVKIYPADQAYPAAPILIFEDEMLAFSADQKNAPEYTIGNIELNWLPVEHAESYGYVLETLANQGWTEVLVETAVQKCSTSIDAAVFESLTQMQLYRLGMYSHGIRAGEMAYT